MVVDVVWCSSNRWGAEKPHGDPAVWPRLHLYQSSKMKKLNQTGMTKRLKCRTTKEVNHY